MAAVSLAACETPVRKAIPYLVKPPEVDPGITNFYATTYVDGGDCYSVVIRSREGRPIKVEGNTLSPVTEGGVNAQVEGSILSFYDVDRLQDPAIDQKRSDWETLDQEIITGLRSVSSQGGRIAVVSQSVVSPTTRRAINEFIAKYPGAELIEYDPVSAFAMRVANEANFGRSIIPKYNFRQAKVIVSVSADFLGTWISSTFYQAV